MKEDRVLWAIFILVLVFVSLVSVHNDLVVVSRNTGSVIDSGFLNVTVEIATNDTINITLPADDSVQVNNTNNATYEVTLNVTNDTSVALWYYSLTDDLHGTLIYQNISFTPNATFQAVRWQNTLSVIGSVNSTLNLTDSVTFNISVVANTNPVLSTLVDQEICEGQKINYSYYAEDIDEHENTLTTTVDPAYNAISSPFDVASLGVTNYNRTNFYIFSPTLNSSHVGSHNLNVSVLDGEGGVDQQNVTITVLSLSSSTCSTSGPSTEPDAGGSGGGLCTEFWACGFWNECVNVEDAFSLGLLSEETYLDAQELCFFEDYSEEICGYQTKICDDVNACNNDPIVLPSPDSFQACYFVDGPSCSDGITNCHEGSCELLVDCGGPCSACATCSDGVQNQGESGVDCGGPCIYSCDPLTAPLVNRDSFVSKILLAAGLSPTFTSETIIVFGIIFSGGSIVILLVYWVLKHYRVRIRFGREVSFRKN